MIIRELLSVFGLDYDGAGQKKAEKGIKAVQKQVDMLQDTVSRLFTVGLVASPFVALTKFASDAQESRNLLDVVFADSAQSVVDWSNTASEALGRSRYTLRDLAAEFGGLVGAMVGPGEQAAKMSTALTELAVDLSSVRNITEDRALTVLQSALAGETEAIKRFGVDLTAAAQDQEAVRLGLGAHAKDLTKAQKAQVRYNIIMRDLAFVAGDAAKTADGFANSSRRMRDGLKDLGTELGFFLLPSFESLLKNAHLFLAYAGTLVRDFRAWAEGTNLAAGALSAVAVIIAAQLLPLLFRLVPLLAAFAVFAFIMDDVITTFKGGDSVLGRFADWLDRVDAGLPGIGGKILQYLLWPFNKLRDLLGYVTSTLYNLYKGLSTGDWSEFRGSIETITGDFWKWKEALDAVLGVAKTVFRIFEKAFSLGNPIIKFGLETLRNVTGTGPAATPPAMAPPQVSAAGAGLASRSVTVNQGSKAYKFEVYQQAGESSEDFARRVTEIMDQRDESLEISLGQELVPAVP